MQQKELARDKLDRTEMRGKDADVTKIVLRATRAARLCNGCPASRSGRWSRSGRLTLDAQRQGAGQGTRAVDALVGPLDVSSSAIIAWLRTSSRSLLEAVRECRLRVIIDHLRTDLVEILAIAIIAEKDHNNYKRQKKL